jgi:hypothetical protein
MDIVAINYEPWLKEVMDLDWINELIVVLLLVVETVYYIDIG